MKKNSKKPGALEAFVVPRRGPQRRQTGAGIHADRRTRRMRDRGAVRRAAIRGGLDV